MSCGLKYECLSKECLSCELTEHGRSNFVREKSEQDGITRVLDILEELDPQMLEVVKDRLYEQDYQELKDKEA